MVECHNCGGEYKSIGAHYSLSDCPHPEFTKRQREIIEGMMLGDGWINHHNDSGNPFFAVGMVNKEFLVYLQDELYPHSTGLKEATGSDISKQQYYKVRTRRNPKLEQYADWYSTGEFKAKQVDMTPLTLKMWYVSDGFAESRGVLPTIRITNKMDGDRERFFGKLFESLPVTPKISPSDIRFGVEDSEFLFEYMGEAPPGFEHKWPSGEVYECPNCQKSIQTTQQPKRCPYCMTYFPEYKDEWMENENTYHHFEHVDGNQYKE